MSVISTPQPQLSISEAQHILGSVYGLKADAFFLDSERDQNFKVSGDDGNEFILKISNPDEDIEIIKLQSAMLKHLTCFDSSLNVPVPIESNTGEIINFYDGKIVRLHSFLKGYFIKDIKNPNAQLFSDFGTFLGKLDIGFNEFNFPKLDRDWVWDIRNIGYLKNYKEYIKNNNDQNIITHFISNYESNILPVEKYLRQQYIHNDGNDHNVLLDNNGIISGIIDFGDLAYTFLICELAVAITYLILEEENPRGKIKLVADGFQSVYPLREEEINSLIHLICIRACITVVTANYRKKLFPDNKYISVTEEKAWTFLRKMIDEDLREFRL